VNDPWSYLLKKHKALLLEFGAVFVLVAFLLIGASSLASAGVLVFASPDETANAVVATMFVEQGNAQITEPLVLTYPWLHPRSWVSQGAVILPVGFLGWPLVASLFVRLVGPMILPWMGVLVLFPTVLALYLLLRRRYGAVPAWFGSLVAWTYPAVLLYANRGLFPNLPILALGILGLFALDTLAQPSCTRGSVRVTVAGLFGMVFALAIAIRPTELLWILPWWVWFGWRLTWTRGMVIAFFGGLFVAGLPAWWYGWSTYHSWLGIGYLLRDNASTDVVVSTTVSSGGLRLPFGLHPRHILLNIRAFLGGLLWPWMTTILAGVFICVLRLRRRLVTLPACLPVLLAGWTVSVLLVIYGSGLYADHIRPGAITIGNSFIRYLLPLAPLCGWAFAEVMAYWGKTNASRVWVRRMGMFCLIVTACVLASTGVYRSFFADDEGLSFTRKELLRYDDIRTTARVALPANAVVFSERSDKIFFPAMSAVSPLPAFTEMVRFIQTEEMPSALFARPLSMEERFVWQQAGIEVQEVQAFGREVLYRLAPQTP